MTDAHARRLSIDELLAEARPQLDRVEPRALAAELGDLMRHVAEHTDVWTTSLGAIAEHVRSLGLPPRTITRP